MATCGLTGPSASLLRKAAVPTVAPAVPARRSQLLAESGKRAGGSWTRHSRRWVPGRWTAGGRRELLGGAAGTAALLVCRAALAQAPPTEVDANGVQRLAYQEEGYQTWTWRGHRINYVCAGEENQEALLLVHGFGASVYHWRYNIPELAKKYKVYAIDLLGFGWSDKALVQYNAALWGDQLADFLREVVQQPAVLAGNSVGGYAVLYTGSAHPDLVRGLVLLNAAGQFEAAGKAGAEGALLQETPGVVGGSSPATAGSVVARLMGPLKRAAQRGMLYLTFLQAKQPQRIRQVLNSVYPDSTNVDDLLVESIVKPSQDPNAAEVYYRLTSQVLLDSSAIPVNRLLSQLELPVLLLWGDLDPWMTPAKAARFLALYPSAKKVGLIAGHCPHDEKPQAVNTAIEEWMAAL